MLIDEAQAKLRFCPFGRGAFPLQGGKFAAGINMAPNGPLTMCEGSACMLWETHQVLQEAKELPCPDCEGKGGCAKCAGSGKYTVQIPHVIGFCGAGFNGPNNAALNKLADGVHKLCAVTAQALKITTTDSAPNHPTPPPNEEVQRGGSGVREKGSA